jgi:hypothetical protein
MTSATFITSALRSASGRAAQAGWAALAAATASATCAAVECGTCPSTSPVAGLRDSNVRSDITGRPLTMLA